VTENDGKVCQKRLREIKIKSVIKKEIDKLLTVCDSKTIKRKRVGQVLMVVVAVAVVVGGKGRGRGSHRQAGREQAGRKNAN
jgi:hypothetical protein